MRGPISEQFSSLPMGQPCNGTVMTYTCIPIELFQLCKFGQGMFCNFSLCQMKWECK